MVFNPGEKECEFDGHPSILEVALSHEVPLNHSCGGMGSCTTCRVIVEKGLEKMDPRNQVEKDHTEARGFGDEERLGCQASAIDGIVVKIP